jgi:hypothetical protein
VRVKNSFNTGSLSLLGLVDVWVFLFDALFAASLSSESRGVLFCSAALARAEVFCVEGLFIGSIVHAGGPLAMRFWLSLSFL